MPRDDPSAVVGAKHDEAAIVELSRWVKPHIVPSNPSFCYPDTISHKAVTSRRVPPRPSFSFFAQPYARVVGGRRHPGLCSPYTSPVGAEQLL